MGYGNTMYFIASGEINVFMKRIKIICSQRKEYDIFASKITTRRYCRYSFRISSVVFIVSLQMPISLRFFFFFFFFSSSEHKVLSKIL